MAIFSSDCDCLSGHSDCSRFLRKKYFAVCPRSGVCVWNAHDNLNSMSGRQLSRTGTEVVWPILLSIVFIKKPRIPCFIFWLFFRRAYSWLFTLFRVSGFPTQWAVRSRFVWRRNRSATAMPHPPRPPTPLCKVRPPSRTLSAFTVPSRPKRRAPFRPLREVGAWLPLLSPAPWRTPLARPPKQTGWWGIRPREAPLRNGWRILRFDIFCLKSYAFYFKNLLRKKHVQI